MAFDLTPAQMGLVRRTIASDCDNEEFDLFMAAAKSYGLDPFRKQIIPLIFNKGNAEKRRMSIVVTRDGSRVIAQRCGNYRPASKPAEFEIDDSLVSKINPKGIVSSRVYLWQRDPAGDWFEVIGEAYWEEFAPIKDEWAWDDSKGKRAPTGDKVIDGKWATMPRLMIQKCAEQQALRAGWPDQFAGLYAEEEMDRARAEDMTASEAVEAEHQRRREERVNSSGSILCMFSGSMERVGMGQFYDRVSEHIAQLEDAEVHAWSVQNREPLNEFWAAQPNDAMELKRTIEARTADIGEAA